MALEEAALGKRLRVKTRRWSPPTDSGMAVRDRLLIVGLRYRAHGKLYLRRDYICVDQAPKVLLMFCIVLPTSRAGNPYSEFYIWCCWLACVELVRQCGRLEHRDIRRCLVTGKAQGRESMGGGADRRQ
jgi:hypothetical protein